MHCLFEIDSWDTREQNMTALRPLSLQRLSAEVAEWQGREARTGRKLTDIGLLGGETFGTRTKPKCALKGAQTNWVLEYLVCHVLPRKQIPLGVIGPKLLAAGQALMRLLTLIRMNPVTMPPAAAQSFFDASHEYLTTMQDLGLVGKPKDHF